MQNGPQNYPYIDIKDPVTGVPIYISEEHAHIHQGEMFDVCELTSLTLGATRDYLITTGATKSPHLKYNLTADGLGNIALYESSTTSAPGSAAMLNNRNRLSAKTPVTGITLSPTVTAIGTMLCAELFGSSNKSGGDARADNEWILKKSSKYIIRVTGTVAINYSIKINFYEE